MLCAARAHTWMDGHADYPRALDADMLTSLARMSTRSTNLVYMALSFVPFLMSRFMETSTSPCYLDSGWRGARSVSVIRQDDSVTQGTLQAGSDLELLI